MKHIYLNLKRFDIPREYGGVNGIAPVGEWGSFIVSSTQEQLKRYEGRDVEFTMFFPEAHLIPAVSALCVKSPVKVGCQGVYREDTSPGGGFGAFTANRTANAARALGCTAAIIGHCEERSDKLGILAEGGAKDPGAVNRILNMEIKRAVSAGLSVLYCVGESQEEHERWREVLKEQLDSGLEGVDRSMVTIAYEPIWAIGPGKTPPDRDYITAAGAYIKKITDGCPVVYGGGLKADNAGMLASVPEMDGGLIALTRFQGDIGFYPREYLEIIKTYMGF
ncbi:MAG: triose-phosphate isomerase [Clostridium sp.]|nr:triose-phosphate isomerase [Clostridium sp.]